MLATYQRGFIGNSTMMECIPSLHLPLSYVCRVRWVLNPYSWFISHQNIVSQANWLNFSSWEFGVLFKSQMSLAPPLSSQNPHPSPSTYSKPLLPPRRPVSESQSRDRMVEVKFERGAPGLAVFQRWSRLLWEKPQGFARPSPTLIFLLMLWLMMLSTLTG